LSMSLVNIARVLIALIALSIISIEVLTTVFTPTPSGEYVLLDTTLTAGDTVADYYTLAYDPTAQQFTLRYMYSANTTLILQTNTTLQAGDALAPHLYTWYFDGVDDNIAIPDSPSLRVDEFTIEIMNLRLTANPIHFEHIIKKPSDVWYGSISITDEPNTNAVFKIEAPQGTENFLVVSNFWTVGQWVHCAYVRKANEAWIYRNSVQVAYKNTWSASNIYYTTHPWKIPDDLGGIQRYISLIRIYSRALSADEISIAYNSKVISASGLVLFLDPTFFNGTHYIDLSGNNNHGVPYNGVQRVPDNNTWIYVVKQLYSDGYIHLRYFPTGTVVRFRDPVNGSIVYSVVVNSDDVVVAGLSGNYVVEALVEYTAGATIYGLPPYAKVVIDDNTVIVPEEGYVTIPPGTHKVRIVANSVRYSYADIPFTYDASNGLLVFNTPGEAALFVYGYDASANSFNMLATLTAHGNAMLYASGNIVYPVVVRYDYQSNAEVVRNSYFIILPNASFYLPAYGTYINTSTVITAKSIEARESEIAVDGRRISVVNANLTIDEWLSNRIVFTADAPSGTVSYIYIRNTDRPKSVVVRHPDNTTSVFKVFLTGDMNQFYLWNGDAAYYNDGERLLAIKIIHHSPAEVELAYSEIAAQAGIAADVANTISLSLLQALLTIALPGIVLVVVISLVLKGVKESV